MGWLRRRWQKHNERLMNKALYDQSIGGGLPLHRDQRMTELAEMKGPIGLIPQPLPGGTLDVHGDVITDETDDAPRSG